MEKSEARAIIILSERKYTRQIFKAHPDRKETAMENEITTSQDKTPVSQIILDYIMTAFFGFFYILKGFFR